MNSVIITGGCGFAGHHFVEHVIKETDLDVIVLDKLTYAAFGYDRLRDIEVYDTKRVSVFSADIAKPISTGIIDEIKKKNPKYLLHLAAETHVDRSITDPFRFIESNVMEHIIS